jgi:hypothetical protein
MGFFTGLITLPLAPVRGTAWIARQLAEEAERQMYDESRLRGALLQLELDHDAGIVDEAEYGERMDALLERMASARQASAAQAQTPAWGAEASDA